MKQETKNKLRKALVEVANREADEAIAGTPGPVILSDEFCEKMEDTILRADQMMYAEKDKYYRTTGIDRRKY